MEDIYLSGVLETRMTQHAPWEGTDWLHEARAPVETRVRVPPPGDSERSPEGTRLSSRLCPGDPPALPHRRCSCPPPVGHTSAIEAREAGGQQRGQIKVEPASQEVSGQ